MDTALLSVVILYHYTFEECADQLRKEGLQPNKDQHSLGVDGQYDASASNIFLTDVPPDKLDFITTMLIGVLGRNYVFEIPSEDIASRGLKIVKNPVNSNILAIVTENPFSVSDAKGYLFRRKN